MLDDSLISLRPRNSGKAERDGHLKTRPVRASGAPSPGRCAQPRALAAPERPGRAGRDSESLSARVSIFRRLPGRKHEGVAAHDRPEYVLHVAATKSTA